uniref:hypothetical protein n=1 Tax=uncultured Erythrobacter sp. TaxID=263913 RepID=UPI002607EF07|nr:hypothetical protein [uncultured Erythrobacter sp.]
MACAAYPAAAADWLRAESEHYVVHAELNESNMRELVQLMEDFDRLLKGQLPLETQPGRKLHMFLDDNDSRISALSDFRNIGFMGSWSEIPATFFVYDLGEDAVFRNYGVFYSLTQYHITNGYFRPNPVWVKTGIPLFYATAYVSEDGDFILGAPDIKRPMNGSMSASKLSMLLTTQIAPRTKTSWRKFYTLSREAMNPLLIEPEYSGLLENYLNAYAAGSSMEDASAEIGDLKVLAKQIQTRRSSRRPTFRRVTLPEAAPADIAIRPMTKDEIELIEPRFYRLRRINSEKGARRLKDLTQEYPESALVWAEYAAAEFARVQSSQFGDKRVFRGFGFSNGELIVTANPYSDAEAWRAVNRALELKPDLAQALTLKSEIYLSRLVRAKDLGDAAAFEEVRGMLKPLANDPARNPLAAALYFQSYIEQEIEPTDKALDLLGRAFVANPAVDSFRYAYAVALSRNGQKDVAERLLSSMLNNPDYRVAAQKALEAN